MTETSQRKEKPSSTVHRCCGQASSLRVTIVQSQTNSQKMCNTTYSRRVLTWVSSLPHQGAADSSARCTGQKWRRRSSRACAKCCNKHTNKTETYHSWNTEAQNARAWLRANKKWPAPFWNWVKMKFTFLRRLRGGSVQSAAGSWKNVTQISFIRTSFPARPAGRPRKRTSKAASAKAYWKTTPQEALLPLQVALKSEKSKISQTLHSMLEKLPYWRVVDKVHETHAEAFAYATIHVAFQYGIDQRQHTVATENQPWLNHGCKNNVPMKAQAPKMPDRESETIQKRIAEPSNVTCQSIGCLCWKAIAVHVKTNKHPDVDDVHYWLESTAKAS